MEKLSMRAARRLADLTQQEIADKIGVSRKSVNNWEKGRRSITKSHFISFCSAVGRDEADIILPE